MGAFFRHSAQRVRVDAAWCTSYACIGGMQPRVDRKTKCTKTDVDLAVRCSLEWGLLADSAYVAVR